MGRFLQDILEIHQRPEKPRKRGLTMVIDPGWVAGKSELFSIAHPYIDSIKSTIPCIYLDEDRIRRNIQTYRGMGVDIQVAGVAFEIAALQGKQKEFLAKIKDVGINVVEIESHAAGLSLDEMKAQVEMFKKQGFKVVGEVGAKWSQADHTRRSRDVIDVKKVIEAMSQLLNGGADYVFWEGMAIRALLGNNLENKKGQAQFMEVAKAVDIDKVFFEVWSAREHANTPLYGWLIHHLGPDVNIGNLLMPEIFMLESNRRGVSYDPDHPYLRWLSKNKPTKNWWEIQFPDYSVDMEAP